MTTKITGDNISSIANTGVTWNAVTVADGSTQLSASAGNGYFLDTNTGVIEVLLPSSPSRGDTIVLADYSGTFATNKVIVNTGGKLIDSTEGGPGSSNDFELTTNNQVVELVFADNDKGWLVRTNSTPSGLTAVGGTGIYGAQFVAATGGTVTTSGNFKIHTFTGDGCFVVSCAGNPGGSTTVDYLVVAGGAGGGSSTGDGGGGGGAGGVRFYASPDITGCYPAKPRNGPAALSLTTQTYPITVGGGSSGVSTANSADLKATNGSDSVFSTITSAGGGGGGGLANPRAGGTGANGGSGGGGNGGAGATSISGGSGNTPPVSPSQGSSGGAGAGGASPDNQAGGGGGFMAAGAAAVDTDPGFAQGGDGGGFPTAFVGSNGEPSSCQQYFGGGGAGGGNRATVSPSPTGPGLGGLGGGGDNGAGSGGNGTANTGGGGAGNGQPSPGPTITGGTGGKGIVIVRYKFQ